MFASMHCPVADAGRVETAPAKADPRRAGRPVAEGSIGCRNRYWNVTVAMARFTLSCGQKVTGPGAAPGAAIFVP
jgi:hypothetical protein